MKGDIMTNEEKIKKELTGMFSFTTEQIRVEGLPAGKRYPLPDSWPVGLCPLRKDFKIEALAGANWQKEVKFNG